MTKMPLAEHDNVVKTLPPDRTDRPFAISVLRRRSRRGLPDDALKIVMLGAEKEDRATAWPEMQMSNPCSGDAMLPRIGIMWALYPDEVAPRNRWAKTFRIVR
jgi:hypothetical protein